MTAQQAMRTAWQIRKAAAAKYGVKVSEILFSPCLKMAWAGNMENLVFKSGYSIPKMIPAKGQFVLRFEASDMKRETEKAIGICFGSDDVNKLDWIPKSQIVGAVMGNKGEKDLRGFVVSEWYGRKNLYSGGAMYLVEK